MRVTVVVPLYNKAPYVHRALESVLSQTHRDFEVIVVDDGSTDGGADVVSRCRDARVRLSRRAHLGLSAARNEGVLQARSEWVAFLDADDEWLPAFLEKVTALAREQPPFVAVFSNRRNGTSARPRLTTAYQRGEVVDHFRFTLENRRSGLHSSATLANRRALIDCGGFPAGVESGEDLDTWARLAWTGRVGCVPEVLAVYHMDTPGSLSNQPAAARAVYPSFVRTFRRWRAEGRVPDRLVASSEMFAQWLLLQHASVLVEAGRAAEARDLLRREYPWRTWPRYGYVRTYLAYRILPRLHAARRAQRAEQIDR